MEEGLSSLGSIVGCVVDLCANQEDGTPISDFEKFFENPNEASEYLGGNLQGFSQTSITGDGASDWIEGPSYRVVAGRLWLLPEGDKAMFWLVLANKNGYIFSPVLTGLLAKNDKGGLSCSVLVEEWQEVKPIYDCLKHLLNKDEILEGPTYSYYDRRGISGRFIRKQKPASFLENTRSEILYLDPPGSFDCEALERDALTLKVLTAKFLIHKGKKSESYAEECAAEADRLAEELRQDCHKRMENFATTQESDAKPKRTIQEELGYLKEIDAWQASVDKITRTRHNFPGVNIDLFPPLSDTSFGFLNDSSWIKRRMQLEPKLEDYAGSTSHPLNF